jgi:hypothetical protein
VGHVVVFATWPASQIHFPTYRFERIVHHRLARGPFGYKPLEGTCKREDKLEPTENKLLQDTDKSKKTSNNIPEKIKTNQ